MKSNSKSKWYFLARLMIGALGSAAALLTQHSANML